MTRRTSTKSTTPAQRPRLPVGTDDFAGSRVLNCSEPLTGVSVATRPPPRETEAQSKLQPLCVKWSYSCLVSLSGLRFLLHLKARIFTHAVESALPSEVSLRLFRGGDAHRLTPAHSYACSRLSPSGLTSCKMAVE